MPGVELPFDTPTPRESHMKIIGRRSSVFM
jgi:hypothetical protein